MLFTPDFPMTLYPFSFKSLNYDPLKDFIAVGPAAKATLTFNVGPAVPDGQNAQRFHRLVQGQSGQGQLRHDLGGRDAAFHRRDACAEPGVTMTPVHYRGGAPAMEDLLGGHVPASVNPVSEVIAVRQIRFDPHAGGHRRAALGVSARRADHEAEPASTSWSSR